VVLDGGAPLTSTIVFACNLSAAKAREKAHREAVARNRAESQRKEEDRKRQQQQQQQQQQQAQAQSQ
jgi:hypothetical protein